MRNSVKISLDGKSFTLVGEESREHLETVAAYIDSKMTEVRQKAVAVNLDSSLAYVLTSLNVADEYFKEKEKVAELEGRVLGLTARVNEMATLLEEMRQKADALPAEETHAIGIEEVPIEEKVEGEPVKTYPMAMKGQPFRRQNLRQEAQRKNARR